jgi:hypothetical protein
MFETRHHLGLHVSCGTSVYSSGRGLVFFPRHVRVYLHFHMVSSSLLSTHVFMYWIDSDGVVLTPELEKGG